MPAPPLLDAVNRNSLAVFLLVGFVSLPPPLLDYNCICANLRLLLWVWGCGTAGKRGDGRGESVNADYVCLGQTSDVRVGSVCVWRVCVRMGDAGTTGVEVVKRTQTRGEDGRPGIHT